MDGVNILAFLAGDDESKKLRGTLEKLGEEEKGLKIDFLEKSTHEEKFKKYAMELVPGSVIIGKKDYGIKYHGVPQGKEYKAYKSLLELVSKGEIGLKEDTIKKIKSLEFPLEIMVFTTPPCTYCPKAINVASQFAMANEKITAVFVDSVYFDELAEKFEVTSVPKIVINKMAVIETQTSEKKYEELILNMISHVEEHIKKHHK